MALIEVKLEPSVLERGVKALERIATAIEEFVFPRPKFAGKMKPRGPECLTEFDPAAEYERERVEDLKGKPL